MRRALPLALLIGWSLACGSGDAPAPDTAEEPPVAPPEPSEIDVVQAPEPGPKPLPAAGSAPTAVQTEPIQTGAIEGGCEPGIQDVSVDGDTLTVEICPNVPLEVQYGWSSEPCEDCEILYVGATARRASDAEHIDLPAEEISPEERGQPVTLTGQVQVPVSISWGVWAEKDESGCARHGCKEYGYSLRGRIEESDFSPIFESRVALMDAVPDVAPNKVEDVRGAVCDEWSCVDGGEANTKRDFVEVLYRDIGDHSEAERIAAVIDGLNFGSERVVVTHWPGSSEAFTVAVGY